MTSNDLDLDDIVEFAQRIHARPTEQDTVERVLSFTRSAVGADFAGVVAAANPYGLETVATTDPVVAEIDAMQLLSRQGPALDMAADRVSVFVPDIATDGRWPEWSRLVAGTGIRSILGVRMYVGEEVFGSLNVYSCNRDAFSVDDQSVVHSIARLAAIALSSTRKEQNLWRAIDSRKVVGQAQGILMERFDLDPDEAFAVLVRFSQTRNVKVVAIAEELVKTRSLPTPGHDGE